MQVVNHHNEMLATWTNVKESTVLVHFDSHPDLGCPLEASGPKFKAFLDSKNLKEVSKAVEIGTWLIPATYMKLVHRIVWITALNRQFNSCDFEVTVGWCHKLESLFVKPVKSMKSVPEVFQDYWVAIW